jgi:hypothetical protein
MATRGTLLFVHGTGVRDVSKPLHLIRRWSAEVFGLDPDRVTAAEWGSAVGPGDLDITPALPASIAGMSEAAEPSESEVTAARWDLLTADPLVEVRALARTGTPGGEEVRQRLAALDLPAEELAEAGVTRADVRVAVEGLRASPELADGTGAPEPLGAAAARAIVATLRARAFQRAGADGAELPALCLDGAVRDALTATVTGQLAGSDTEEVFGLPEDILGPLARRLATRAAMRRRAQLMDPLSDFVRDIAFYTQRGEEIRDYLAKEIRAHAGDRPVVVLGHSLGGIIAVDLLADPAVLRGSAPLPVDLLVTVGSQAPFLFLLDALAHLRPNGRTPPEPFLPWVNVFNRQDLLSFCAGRVFPDSPGIVDTEVDAGVPFPESHSAYWGRRELYEVLGSHWPTR